MGRPIGKRVKECGNGSCHSNKKQLILHLDVLYIQLLEDLKSVCDTMRCHMLLVLFYYSASDITEVNVY